MTRFSKCSKREDRQIKGEYQLTDLAEGADFTTQKFDEYKKDQREKDTIIATPQSDLKSFSMKAEDFEKKMDRQVQYSSRNCILIDGSKEEKTERTDVGVLELFIEELYEAILSVDLDMTHKIEQKRGSNSKLHPAIENLHGTIFVKKFLKVKSTQGKEH